MYDVRFPFKSAGSSYVLLVLAIIVPVVSFFVVLNRQVRLVPLIGMESACAQCDRKATRTLLCAADSLRLKGHYVYDRQNYPKTPPVWCNLHRPDCTVENAGTALFAAIAAFAMIAAAYSAIAPT